MESSTTKPFPVMGIKDIRSKLPRPQLKSNIPKPVPYVRRSREQRSKSCSSSCFKGTPLLCTSESLNRRSLSQNSPPSEQMQNKKSAQTLSLQSHSGPSRNSSSKSLYPNVKAKIDKTPLSLLLKCQGLHSKASLKQSNNDLVENSSNVSSLAEEPPGDQVSKGNFPDNQLEKEKKCVLRGLDNYQSSLDIQVLKSDVGSLTRKETFDHMEGTKSYLLKDCAHEFLSSFQKQMEGVSELWLQLICDLIVTKMTIGKSTLSQISLHDPKLSRRDEITKFFQNLPTQGELLHKKLCKIEDEQMTILHVVVENTVALIKEREELKEKHSTLEETYNQVQSQLKEELAILGQENKALNEKYTSAVEQCELEKSKMEEHENNQIEIMKKVLELRQVVKLVERKCKELEDRGETVETNRLNLEESLSHLETIHEKNNKKYEDLFKRHIESENIISKLKLELKESEKSRTSMNKNVKDLEGELRDLRASFDDGLQKRTKLEEELCDKLKEMKQLETEINLLKSNKTECHKNKIPLMDETNIDQEKDLVNDVEQRNSQIQELKKKINRLEHMLRDKSNREEKLLAYVTKLNKKCVNNCTSLNTRIKELQNSVKSLQGQVSELEKVLGQKTLELDQRDRLIKELKELIQLKNQSYPSMCQGRKHPERKCTEKLMSVETDKGSSFCNKRIIEMFSLLERKQMEIMKLEHRIWGLQTFQYEKGKTGRSKLE